MHRNASTIKNVNNFSLPHRTFRHTGTEVYFTVLCGAVVLYDMHSHICGLNLSYFARFNKFGPVDDILLTPTAGLGHCRRLCVDTIVRRCCKWMALEPVRQA